MDALEPSSEDLNRQKGLLKQFNAYFCDICGILCKFSLYIRKCRSFFLFVVLQAVVSHFTKLTVVVVFFYEHI